MGNSMFRFPFSAFIIFASSLIFCACALNLWLFTQRDKFRDEDDDQEEGGICMHPGLCVIVQCISQIDCTFFM